MNARHPELRKTWWGRLRVVLLILLPVIAYIPAMRGGFIWDDNHMVFGNPLIKAGLHDGLRAFWFTRQNFDFFPLTSTSLWIEWRLWGMNAMGYHVVNVLLHVISSLLLWRLLKRLKVPAAWLIAVVFALHPVGVASVAWIAERKNTLCMVFYLLALDAYVRYEEMPGSRTRARWGWYLAAWFAFLAALLAKTAVVTLPLVLLLLDWWRAKRVPATEVSTGRRVLRAILPTLPFFALSLIMGLVTIAFQYGRAIGPGIVRPESMLSRILGVGWALWFYLGKALMPLKLLMVYPRWDIDPTVPWAWAPLLLYLLGLLALWRYRAGWGRHALAAVGYQAISLIPVLGFFKIYFMRFSLVGDHWQYFSFIGPPALLIAGAAHALHGRRGAVRRAGAAAAVLLVAVLFVLTWRQASLYRSEDGLWIHNIRHNPDGWVAYNNLATLQPRGSHEAVELYSQAVQLNPRYQEAHYGLGLALSKRGDNEQAIVSIERAVALRPDYFLAQNSLGELYITFGDFERAVTHLRKAIATRGNFAAAHVNLGIALAMLGQSAEAEQHFRRGIAQGYPPDEAFYMRGVALQNKARRDEAASDFRNVLAIAPHHAPAHVNLGILLAEAGNDDQAEAHYRAALQVNPGMREANYNLATLLFAKERFDEAVDHFKTAALADPSDPRATFNLGAALYNSGRTNDAITTYKDIIRQFPDLADTYKALAVLYGNAGNWSAARDVYADLLERDPYNAQAHLDLAEVQVHLNAYADAIARLRAVANAAAEAGRSADAMAVIARAMEIAETGGVTNLTATLQAELDAYAEQGRESGSNMGIDQD